MFLTKEFADNAVEMAELSKTFYQYFVNDYLDNGDSESAVKMARRVVENHVSNSNEKLGKQT